MGLRPPLDFLSIKKEVVKQLDQHLCKGKMLEKVLADFKIKGEVIEISVGPNKYFASCNIFTQSLVLCQ